MYDRELVLITADGFKKYVHQMS